MKRMKRITLLLTAVLAVGALLCGCSSKPPEEQSEGLREFTAETLDGGSFSPEDIQAKDLTVINFWATFCSPCLEEMPDLAAFAKALPDNVRFLTVCLDADTERDSAVEILQQAGYEGITLVSGDGDFAKLSNRIQAIPTTVFVSSDGTLTGTEIVGGGMDDLSGTFLAAVNDALEASGKEAITLAE